jgi:hypothetical protein
MGTRPSLVTEATGGSDPNLVIAALLYDAVEDQGVPFKQPPVNLGNRVADLVLEVTDDKSFPKEERKRKQIEAAPKRGRFEIGCQSCNWASSPSPPSDRACRSLR